MDAGDRETRRWLLRVARVLTGFVILVCGAGALLWVNARFHPWTDRGLADVRASHAVLHVVNESGVRCELAWRCLDGPHPATWLPLPPPAGTPAGVLEARGFRLLAPLPPPRAGDTGVTAAPGAGAAPPPDPAVAVELRVTLAGATRTLEFAVRPDAHVQLRIAPDRALFLATGDANWLGAPSFGAEVPATDAPDTDTRAADARAADARPADAAR